MEKCDITEEIEQGINSIFTYIVSSQVSTLMKKRSLSSYKEESLNEVGGSVVFNVRV